MARILIVEDEVMIAEDLKYKLERLRHTVVGQATTGEDAVSNVEELQPELVLMDIRLRGRMSGLEAAQRIRQLHSVPVVFVTAHASTIAWSTGAEPQPLVIKKPFTLDQIESVIQEICPTR